MDLGEILGNISFSAILILGMMYIFYLIIKIAVRQAIIALLPKIKSEFKEYIIEVIYGKHLKVKELKLMLFLILV